MRNILIGLTGVVALPLIIAAGCADYGGSNISTTAGGNGSSGGSSSTSTSSGTTGGSANGGAATGGSANGGAATGGASAAPSCPAMQPCGGNLEGTWNVSSSGTCLNLSGTIDLSMIGADCKSGTVDDGTESVTGSITFTADGNFTDSTTTTITEHLTLPESCKNISNTVTNCPGLNDIAGTMGYSKIECADKPGGNGACACTATLSATTPPPGGLGFVDTNILTDGMYTKQSSDNTFTLTDGRQQFVYSYCVKDNSLTLLPKSKIQTVSGTVTLTKG